MTFISKFGWIYLTLILSLPALADLPTSYSSKQIVGKVEKITSLKVWGEPCKVIHLSNASGFDRKASNSLLKILRRSGYEPDRKTLRPRGLAIVLPEKQLLAITEGDWIRVKGYHVSARDNRTLVSQGSSKEVTKINKPKIP